MNLVKQGMGLKSIKSFENIIPKNMVQDFYSIGDKIVLRMHGYDLLIGLRATFSQEDSSQLSIEGFDLPRNLDVKPHEHILAIELITIEQRIIQEEQK